ncbi:hypothetical protein [Actinopolymorpha alba]|uniref:hypothetical protein n=1 Tax=Actinopolymorpha alba TaxID=533267 RepID=UPI0003A29363|nr:hypothetical protein [Actinopolymorpha alba]
MPADFEPDVTEHLSRLRSDVDQVTWADDARVRQRGARRQVGRTATTGLAVAAGISILGYSAAVGIPGTPISPVNQFFPEGSPSRSSTVARSTPPVSPSESAHPESPSRTTYRPSAPGQPRSPSSPRSTTSPGVPGTPGTPTQPGTPSSGPTAAPPAPTTGTPSSTPSPTDSETPAPPPSNALPEVSQDALLAPEQMPKVNDSEVTWSTIDSSDGEGSTPASVCQAGDLTSLGAVDTVRRDYTWGPDGTVSGTNVVGVFKSSDEASAAYDAYADSLSGCTWGSQHGPTDGSVTSGTASWWWFGHETADGSGEIEVVGLVRNGPALSVIVWHQGGQDLIYDSDPMAPSLQASSDLLASYAGS